MGHNWLYLLKYFVFLIFMNVVHGITLYKPSDKIVLLENDTIKPVIYNSNFAWFVEFYSSWCGHCQQFAPKWKRLGKRVEGWNSVIQVAAIDCSEARNMHTCESFKIQGYPTLKFFKAFTNDTKQLGTVYEGIRTPYEMQHAMIDFLEAKGNPQMKLDFAPIKKKISGRFSEEEHLPKPVALVFENISSYLGRELMLDLMNNPNVSVKRVVNDNIRRIKYNINKLPQVVLLLENDKFIHLKKSQTRRDILSELREYHVKKMPPTTPKAIEVTNLHFRDLHRTDVVVKHKKENAFILYMRDLESALTFILQREIVIKTILHKKHLADFVDLLVQCFPGRPNVNKFLKELHLWLQEKVKDKGKPLTRENLRLFYNMHKVDLMMALPEEIKWQTCQGSRPQFRGYPCSLWILFHTLTVNCAMRKGTTLSGADILTRIRGYVKSFFSCIECSRHFAEMSKHVGNEVHSHEEAILWLWRAHNRVNNRLKKEASADPHFPKIQYPPKDICAECSGPNNTWRDSVVLNYLKAHYSVHNIRLSDSPEASDSVRYISSKDLVRVIGFGMTYFDTSLCVVVYGAGVAVLAMLYIYVLKRRRHSVKHLLGMA